MWIRTTPSIHERDHGSPTPKSTMPLRFSEVYRFFSTGELGITASFAAPMSADLPTTVAGGDLAITEIARFLKTLDLGAGGRAVIVDESGALVAASLDDAPDEGEIPTVADAGDRVLAEAFQRFRVTPGTLGLVEIDDSGYLISAASLSDLVGRPWWALLIAREEAFIGFVETNARNSLYLSGVVVALATLVAALLTYQGLQSDARARRARRSEAAVLNQRATLEALADLDGLVDVGDQASLRRFAVIAAETAGARRVAVWWLDRDRLVNAETFDGEARAHTAAATLRADHLGDVWSKVLDVEGWTVDEEDESAAARHLRGLYLDGVGTRRLDTVPVMSAGEVLGCVWFEDPDPASAVMLSRSLAKLMASMLAPRFERLRAGRGGQEESAGAPPSLLPPADAAADGSKRGTHIAIERDRALLRRLLGRGGPESLTATLFPRIAVLHLKLGDTLGLAGGNGDSASGIAALVEAAQEAAASLDVPYLKLLGDILVAADGFTDTGDGDARLAALADLALALQPVCRHAEQTTGQRASYRLGLDVGPAFGSTVGFGEVSFNLWGEALHHAERMAVSAPPTAIQTTEAAYRGLAPAFLLRRRGSFFIDGVGETDTFVLAGRL